MRPAKLACEVTEKVGGNGTGAVLKNGPGPVVLIRTIMDALPIIEQTGLTYARNVKVKEMAGNETGVLAACGRDIDSPRAQACWSGSGERVVWLAQERDGNQALAGLLSPLAWLSGQGIVGVGDRTDLDLPVMGAEGAFQAVAIVPCPAIERGAGRIVMEWYSHRQGMVCGRKGSEANC